MLNAETNHLEATSTLPVPVASIPNSGNTAQKKFATPWAQGEPGRAILIEIEPAVMRYKPKEFTAQRGERLSVTLFNRGCPLQHNWLLLTAGSLQKVGDLADRMLSDAQSFTKNYVPNSREILVWTDLIGIGQSITVHFNAPSNVGNYPYVCTFPGSWQTMNGVMRVVE
jgi:azurin